MGFRRWTVGAAALAAAGALASVAPAGPARQAPLKVVLRSVEFTGAPASVRVRVSAARPLSRVSARLYRGRRLVGETRVQRLAGRRMLVLRVARPVPGRHVLRISGRAASGRTVRVSASVRLVRRAAGRPRWWEGWSMDDPRLSQPVYDKALFEEVPITAPDGTKLAAAVLRPETPPGVRVPAIMQLSPYLGSPIRREQILANSEIQKHKIVERGYALIAVSVRGSGASGGCLDYEGERERGDVNAILDAIAAQPWSNGRVGGMGLSWDGTTLNAAALSGNPHLKAIVPAASITDWYRWSFMQGVPGWYVGYTFNIYGPAVVAGAGVFGAGAPAPEQGSQRFCQEVADGVTAQGQSILDGTRNAWWDERNLLPHVDRVNRNLAVLQVSGYIDDGVRIDHLHEWDRALRARLPNYRLLVGDWLHLWPDTPNTPLANNPDVQVNEHPMKNWSTLLLRWFDRWLLDKPTGVEDLPGALLQGDDGEWHEEDALTPARAVMQRLHPTPDFKLAPFPAGGSLSFIDDGANVDPRGTCAWFAGGLFIGCVPVDQPNAQFFVTEPFAGAVRYSGVPRARLRLRHSMPRGQVGVTVYDVDGERWRPMTYGFASMLLRDGEYEAKPVEADVPFTQSVELLARDFTIPPGRRLGVAIGSQVGRYPVGISGNGYFPAPTGGTTDIELAQSVVELPRLPDLRPAVPCCAG